MMDLGPRGLGRQWQQRNVAPRGSLRRRGFTLIEVMIALALMIVLAALVFPMFSGFSESVEFKETCDQLSSAVSVCRSEAQRRGTPMELVSRKESDGRVSLVGRPAKLDDTKQASANSGQVLMVLPHGYSIDHDSGVATQPAPDANQSSEESGSVDAAPARVQGSDADVDDTTPKPLVVFWASGGASKGSGLYLHGRGGRVVGAEINSFTGMLRLEQVATPDGSDEKSKTEAKQDGKPNQGKPDSPMGVDPNGP